MRILFSMIGPVKTVGIYVEDPEKALAFYTNTLGFELRRKIDMEPGVSWIEVAPPDAQTCLVLYPKALMTNWQELKPSVVFECPDVEKTCFKLNQKGVKITMPPTPMAWGMFAKFADIDGNEFGLTSQEMA